LFSAAILAGGRARRPGARANGALAVGGAAILERQFTVLRAITPHILIVGGERSHEQTTGVPSSRIAVRERVRWVALIRRSSRRPRNTCW
jgi:molybdopterin-guanine dinucleotide biosynthesis protein A